MKFVHAIVFALALSACGPPAATTPQPGATASADAQGKPDASAPAHTPPAVTNVSDKPDQAPANGLTPAMLVGRWGDNGDCTKDIVINADGTFHSYTGGGGNWSLNGDVMSMTGGNGAFQVRVAVINGRTLMITNPDGSVGTSQRC